MKPRKNLFVNKYKSNGGNFYFGTGTFFNEADACNAGRDSANWICAVEFIQKEIEQPQPEQYSSELKTMLIKDAIEAGLKKGDRVWVELRFDLVDNDDETIGFLNSDNESLWADAKCTQIIYTPQPFIPKNGEKCRFEVVNTTTDKGKILECTALHLEGNIHAFVSLSDAANGGFYEHSEIKKFLPLE